MTTPQLSSSTSDMDLIPPGICFRYRRAKAVSGKLPVPCSSCPDEFVINFDEVWSWMGFSRKDVAKRLVEKTFYVGQRLF
jgi:glycine cleavage system protein P-like pyridoxal-binding family